MESSAQTRRLTHIEIESVQTCLSSVQTQTLFACTPENFSEGKLGEKQGRVCACIVSAVHDKHKDYVEINYAVTDQ